LCHSIGEDRVAVVEKFGKFQRVAEPGCLCTPVPGIWSVAGTVSTRIQQIRVIVETTTKDSVFVKVSVDVQFVLLANSKASYDAFYKLANPAVQINSYVEDVVRAAVPALELDALFLEKKHIAESITAQLEKEMESFGYRIVASLITDIDPHATVKKSMNEVNASRRLRFAQGELAEGAKYVQVKAAEAKSEATYLMGEGVARQRKAIVHGMKESVEGFRTIPGMKSNDVVDLILINEYFDALKSLGHGKDSELILTTKRIRD